MNVTSAHITSYQLPVTNYQYAKQSQTKPNKLEANLAEIPTGELLRILKPGTNQTQFQRRAADEEFNKKGRKRIAYGLSVHNQNVSHYKGLYPPRIMADLSMYQGGCRI